MNNKKYDIKENKRFEVLFLLALYLILLSLIAFGPLKNFTIKNYRISEFIGLYEISYINTDTDDKFGYLKGEGKYVEHFNYIAYFSYVFIGIVICFGLYKVDFDIVLKRKIWCYF